MILSSYNLLTNIWKFQYCSRIYLIKYECLNINYKIDYSVINDVSDIKMFALERKIS